MTRRSIQGRPRLHIPLERIFDAVRHHGTVMGAARELGCSDAYIHVKLRRLGLTLADVLEAPDTTVLLYQVSEATEA